MSKVVIPTGYQSVLSPYETQTAIGILRQTFQNYLGAALNLKRVTAPLFVDPTKGLNDDLNGVERAVSFDIAETQTIAQVVHSLAKWKRLALYQYGFPVGEGLYTDMNAIRRDEEMTNLHSIYVDQWDWEKVITKEQRTLKYLQETVTKIIGAVCDTLDELKKLYPQITTQISRDIRFITTQELEDLYPTLTPKQRENAFVREHKTVFLMQIGDKLKSGQRHDGRAPDYDDWSLNGDILIYNEVLDLAFEISSMGIRVDAASLASQLQKADAEYRRELTFHKMLLAGQLPLTIGGGIGQSRLCMLLLGKAHIGEVQVSIWDKNTVSICQQAGIKLL